MSLPQITSRAEWLVARKELLVEEKDLTTRRDRFKTRSVAACPWSRSRRTTSLKAPTARWR